MNRMVGERIPEHTVQCKPAGQRDRGRPRKYVCEARTGWNTYTIK
jgi:hypothetical protein